MGRDGLMMKTEQKRRDVLPLTGKSGWSSWPERTQVLLRLVSRRAGTLGQIQEAEKFKNCQSEKFTIRPNTMGAQIPNMFGIQMVRVCSDFEWFSFRMVKQDDHHFIKKWHSFFTSCSVSAMILNRFNEIQ